MGNLTLISAVGAYRSTRFLCMGEEVRLLLLPRLLMLFYDEVLTMLHRDVRCARALCVFGPGVKNKSWRDKEFRGVCG